MLPHPLDLIALILGILFVLRHTHVAGQEADKYPGVSVEDFERWKRRRMSAYKLGFSACFGKVLLDLAFSTVLRNYTVPSAVRWGVGISLDVGWVVLVAYSYLQVMRSRTLPATPRNE